MKAHTRELLLHASALLTQSADILSELANPSDNEPEKTAVDANPVYDTAVHNACNDIMGLINGPGNVGGVLTTLQRLYDQGREAGWINGASFAPKAETDWPGSAEAAVGLAQARTFPPARDPDSQKLRDFVVDQVKGAGKAAGTFDPKSVCRHNMPLDKQCRACDFGHY